MSEPTVPFYKRELLPRWFPGWLAASLLVAAGFAVCFGLFLEGNDPVRTAAVAGLIGFALALLILSAATARYRGDKPNPLAPPAVIWRPMMTAVVLAFPLFWSLDRRVTLPLRRGDVTILTGQAAEFVGIVGMITVASLLGLAIWTAWRHRRVVEPSMLLSLAVAVVALAVAIVSVAGHRAA